MIQKGEHSRAQKELLAELRDRVKVHRFTEKFSEQSYYCLVPEGKWALHVSFIRHRDDFDLTADVAVRIDRVEDLVNAYDTKRTPAEKRNSMTLGGELGNIAEGRFRRWTVSKFDDIPRVCDELQKTFERVGLPFLKSHSEVSAAHRVLVGSSPRDQLLAPIVGPRYMRAVAAAFITGATNLDSLIAQYEAELLGSEDLYLEDFRAFAGAYSRRTYDQLECFVGLKFLRLALRTNSDAGSDHRWRCWAAVTALFFGKQRTRPTVCQPVH